MRVLIDSNILLDVISKREPFLKYSKAVISVCQQEVILGAITAQTVADVFYILRKEYSYDERCRLLLGFCKILHVIAVDGEKIVSALQNRDFTDFEDCLQAKCAVAFEADYIITRNVKHFEKSSITAITPEDFITNYRSLMTKKV